MPHKGKARNYPSTPGHPNPSGDTSSGLRKGYEKARKQGVGIIPGTHPEFEKPTPLERVSGFFRGLGRRKANSTGNDMSPTTTKDEGITKDPAELERIARRYVDRK